MDANFKMELKYYTFGLKRFIYCVEKETRKGCCDQ